MEPWGRGALVAQPKPEEAAPQATAPVVPGSEACPPPQVRAARWVLEALERVDDWKREEP